MTKYVDLNESAKNLKAGKALSAKEEAKTHQASTIANVRGNLALVFAELVALETKNPLSGEKSTIELNFGLLGVVEVFIDMLRKERGHTQKNASVCVTKLAMSHYLERSIVLSP